VDLIRRRQERREARPRRIWCRPWLGVDRRFAFGQFSQLMPELRREDPASYINFVRMTPDLFDELVDRLSPGLTKQDTHYRNALQPALKVAITLRHLATGERYTSMRFGFRVPHNTISKLVKEVCEAIVLEFKDEVLKCPTTSDGWRPLTDRFASRWNLPHACGALDGKHVAIKKPFDSGSMYHNYKGFFSIVLMALVDADYKFIWVDIGGMGHMSDAQIFNVSELREFLETCQIGLPKPDRLPHDDKDTAYYIVGDDAFALQTWLMKPFSTKHLTHDQRIFNYRLSRARRVVENAFGIMAQRWQVLLTTMQQTPTTTRTITECCVILHNWLRIKKPSLSNDCLDREDENHNWVDGSWRTGQVMLELQKVKGPTKVAEAAKRQREYLKHYMNSPVGSVSWQEDML
jgi:hypothetical protein